MNDTEELWEDFETYVIKLKKMIIKLHNREPLTDTDQFSKLEYSECYKYPIFAIETHLT
jgi:hypothetical protein